MIRELTCIRCPRGCRVSVTLNEDGTVTSLEGNACKRGDTYVRSELAEPKRMLTTTLPVMENHMLLGYVPVKTATDIPKEELLHVQQSLVGVSVEAPIRMGDILVEAVSSASVPLVATADFSKRA